MYKSDYESFVSNPIWKEIVATLVEVKSGILFDLADIDPFKDGTSIARQQGRIKMLEFVLALPADILREIEETKLKEEENKDGRE